MKKKVFFLLILVSFSEITAAQSKSFKKITVSNFVFNIRSKHILLRDSINCLEVLSLWDNFLSSDTREAFANANWSNKEVQFFGQADYTYRFVDGSLFASDMLIYDPLVLTLRNVDSTAYEIKTAFTKVYNGVLENISSIRNILVVRENGKWVFQSPLYSAIQNLQKSQIGNITYWYGSNVIFNENKAIELNKANDRIAALYNVTPYRIKYIITNSRPEYLKLLGYDFHVELGTNNYSGGMNFDGLKIIFSGNGREDYLHELVHIYTGYKSPDCHVFFNEGVSTYFGGSLDRDLDFHLKVLSKFNKSKSLKFDNTISLSKRIGITKIDDTISGLFCKIMFEREGMNGIFKLLRPGNTDDDLFKTIEQVVGVKRENLNEFILKELKKYE